MGEANHEQIDVLTTFGNSMLGVFSPGDQIYARKVDFSEPEIGDIIIFTQRTRRRDRMVVHRVIKRDESKIITHGDNNLLPDRPISRGNGDIYLVTKALRNNKPVPFSHGVQGMQDFKLHQQKRRLINRMRQLMRAILFFAPLRFIAPPVSKLEYKEFRRNGVRFKSMLFYKNKPVATFNFKRHEWRINNWWLLLYTPEMLNIFNPDKVDL